MEIITHGNSIARRGCECVRTNGSCTCLPHDRRGAVAHRAKEIKYEPQNNEVGGDYDSAYAQYFCFNFFCFVLRVLQTEIAKRTARLSRACRTERRKRAALRRLSAAGSSTRWPSSSSRRRRRPRVRIGRGKRRNGERRRSGERERRSKTRRCTREWEEGEQEETVARITTSWSDVFRKRSTGQGLGGPNGIDERGINFYRLIFWIFSVNNFFKLL